MSHGVFTTLKKLRDAGACADRYAHLKKSLGKNYGDDTPVNLVTILETNGLKDALWIPEEAVDGDNIQRRYRLFAVACCQDIYRLMKDQRSIEAVKVAHLFAHGEASQEELTAAWGAARDAARAAAWDAARAAARAAAWDAAWDAARDRQGEHFKIIFSANFS